MRKVIVSMTMATILFAICFPFGVAAKGWEVLKAEITEYRKVAGDADIEIRTDRGVVIVNTNKNVNIKIFTILGSQIANDNLTPGTYRYAVPAHGVYIVKVGELTCKVAI